MEVEASEQVERGGEDFFLDPGQYQPEEPEESQVESEPERRTTTDTAPREAPTREKPAPLPPEAQQRLDEAIRQRDGLRGAIGEIRREANELKAWKQQIERERAEEELALQAIEADEADAELEALKEQDRVGYLIELQQRGSREAVDRVTALERQLAEERQRVADREAFDQAANQTRELIDRFRQARPDYDDAARHFYAKQREAYLQHRPEADDAEVLAWLRDETAKLHIMALQNPQLAAAGAAPALIYQYAVETGYTPPQPQNGTPETPRPQGALAQKRRALAGASTVSAAAGRSADTGGKYTLGQISELTEDEYAALRDRGFNPMTDILRD